MSGDPTFCKDLIQEMQQWMTVQKFQSITKRVTYYCNVM